MKTALYARKSTESDDRQAQSIDDQIRSMEAIARREGIRIDETYVEARSAKAPHTRPEFRRLTDDIEAGRVTRLVVWSMNRLSRNLVDGGLIAHLLQTGRLEWIRTSDRTYRPEDNALLLSIENGMATSFIQDLRKNVVRGMDGKADRGWRPGRAPLGYLNNPVTREIDPDPVRFPLVRRAWETLLLGGHTPSQIYHLMVVAGLTSKGSRQRVLPLTAGVVYAMFSNPFYKGSFLYKGEERHGKHRPVVTREEFDATQRILGRGTLRRKRKNDFDYFRAAPVRAVRVRGGRRPEGQALRGHGEDGRVRLLPLLQRQGRMLEAGSARAGGREVVRGGLRVHPDPEELRGLDRLDLREDGRGRRPRPRGQPGLGGRPDRPGGAQARPAAADARRPGDLRRGVPRREGRVRVRARPAPVGEAGRAGKGRAGDPGRAREGPPRGCRRGVRGRGCGEAKGAWRWAWAKRTVSTRERFG